MSTHPTGVETPRTPPLTLHDLEKYADGSADGYRPSDEDAAALVAYIARLTERNQALEAALRVLSKQGEQAVEAGEWPQDWACAECRPYSEIIVEGFQCGRHTALALTDTEAPHAG